MKIKSFFGGFVVFPVLLALFTFVMPVFAVINANPTITLEGASEVEIMKGGTFVDDGASCADVEDGLIFLTIDEGGFSKNTVGEYTFTYTCTDQGGATDSTTRKVTVKNALPSAILDGVSPVEIIKGGEFVDDGASCADVEDGLIFLTIDEGGFDKDIPGTYTFTYTCTDEDKGTASTTRTVIVKDDSIPSGGGGGAPGVVILPSFNIAPAPVVVAPAQVGEVLGVESSVENSCMDTMYITKFLRKGYENDIEAVKKLQNFLNKYENADLKEDGVFGLATEQAVKNFQKKYASEILTPWNIKSPTGIFYLTTQKKVNSIVCPELSATLPSLLAFSDNPETPNR